MIYGKSHDAILIKKITLHVWPLRQEVEQRIQERLEHGESKEAIIKSLQSTNFVAAEFPPVEENKTAETTATENQGETAKDEATSSEASPAADTNAEEAAPEAAAQPTAEEAKPATEETKPATEETKPATEEAKPEAENQAAPPEATTADAATTPAADSAVPANEAADATADAPAATPTPTDSAAPADKTPAAEAAPTEPPPPPYYQGTMVLQEINMRDMCFFCESSFLEGQEVLVEFQIPTKFKILGTVHYARRYAFRSTIIGRQNLPYRVYLTFNFAQDSDKIPLRNFLQHISTLNHKEKPLPVKAS